MAPSFELVTFRFRSSFPCSCPFLIGFGLNVVRLCLFKLSLLLVDIEVKFRLILVLSIFSSPGFKVTNKNNLTQLGWNPWPLGLRKTQASPKLLWPKSLKPPPLQRNMPRTEFAQVLATPLMSGRGGLSLLATTSGRDGEPSRPAG